MAVMAGKVRDQAAGLQEMLRTLAVLREGFVQDTARVELDLARASALDAKTAALIVVGVVVAIGASPACLRWSASRALAATARTGRDYGVSTGPQAG
jgi:alkylhydroperoxidase/carboxymuconolactone decarboxylase family protein YurZ